eukprot:1177919-Prorocentrum_minimum.AAC.1
MVLRQKDKLYVCVHTEITKNYSFSYLRLSLKQELHAQHVVGPLGALPSLPFGHSPSVTRLLSLAFGHSPSVTRLRSLAFGHSPSVTRLRSLAFGHSPSVTPLLSLAFGHSPSVTHLPSLTHVVGCCRCSGWMVRVDARGVRVDARGILVDTTGIRRPAGACEERFASAISKIRVWSKYFELVGPLSANEIRSARYLISTVRTKRRPDEGSACGTANGLQVRQWKRLGSLSLSKALRVLALLLALLLHKVCGGDVERSPPAPTASLPGAGLLAESNDYYEKKKTNFTPPEYWRVVCELRTLSRWGP